ncbi:MAG: hypothetical protein IT381_19750 [Deltaproteobacteria bacterium]|nr:hypothetical protein [Deltaproteobacteria bacterium]
MTEIKETKWPQREARKIARQDRLGKLVAKARDRITKERAAKKRVSSVPKQARLVTHVRRKGGATVESRAPEAALNAAEAIIYVRDGVIDAKDFLGLSEDEAIRIARHGLALLDRDDNDAARSCGVVATAFAPRFAPAWLVLACANARLRRDAEAIIAYQQVSVLEPTNTRALVDLAELYVRNMHFSLASQTLERALAIEKDVRSPIAQRAQLLVVNTLMTLEQD